MLEEGTACAIGGQVKRRGAILVAIPCAFHIHRGGVVAKKTKHTHTHTHTAVSHTVKPSRSSASIVASIELY